MSTIIGITSAMAREVQSVLDANPEAPGLLALPNMKGYFVSREDKGELVEGASRLFPLEMDGRTVYIYLRI